MELKETPQQFLPAELLRVKSRMPMLLTINTFIATDQEAIALTIKIIPMMMKFFNPYTFILLGMFALSGYAQEARNQYRNELLQEEKEAFYKRHFTWNKIFKFY